MAPIDQRQPIDRISFTIPDAIYLLLGDGEKSSIAHRGGLDDDDRGGIIIWERGTWR